MIKHVSVRTSSLIRFRAAFPYTNRISIKNNAHIHTIQMKINEHQ